MIAEKPDVDNLLLNYCKGTISQVDSKQLQAWIDSSETNKLYATRFVALYREGREIAYITQYNTPEAWNRLNVRLNKRKNRVLSYWMYAAAVLLIGVITTVLIQNVDSESPVVSLEQIAVPGSPKAYLTMANGEKIDLQQMENFAISCDDGQIISKDSTNRISYQPSQKFQKEISYNTINVPVGGEYSMLLSDGTEVFFNSDTEMEYPVQFVGKSRTVQLIRGEALFKVKHQADLPFIVHTAKGDVEVLGTTFNLSAYADEDYMATTLVEGRVKVYRDNHSKIIDPGTQAIIRDDNQVIETKQVDPLLYISWVDGVFEFENAELSAICKQLGRWYQVDFEFKDEALKNLHFTGAAHRDKSIRFLCEMIEKTTDVEFSIESGKIIIE